MAVEAGKTQYVGTVYVTVHVDSIQADTGIIRAFLWEILNNTISGVHKWPTTDVSFPGCEIVQQGISISTLEPTTPETEALLS